MMWDTASRSAGMSHRDFFEAELSDRLDGTLIDLAATRGRAFCAWEDDRGVRALIIDLRWEPKRYQNFIWELQEESEVAGALFCPPRILAVLDPPELFYIGADLRRARAWREKCAAYQERRRGVPPVRRGDLVEFDYEITFSSGARHRVLRFERGSTFTVGGGRFHIRNWRERQFTVRRVDAQAGAADGATRAGSMLAARLGGAAA